MLFTQQLQEDGKTTKMYEHEGVWFADTNCDKDILQRLPEWEARSDDAYVVSYPKAGNQ